MNLISPRQDAFFGGFFTTQSTTLTLPGNTDSATAVDFGDVYDARPYQKHDCAGTVTLSVSADTDSANVTMTALPAFHILSSESRRFANGNLCGVNLTAATTAAADGTASTSVASRGGHQGSRGEAPGAPFGRPALSFVADAVVTASATFSGHFFWRR